MMGCLSLLQPTVMEPTQHKQKLWAKANPLFQAVYARYLDTLGKTDKCARILWSKHFVLLFISYTLAMTSYQRETACKGLFWLMVSDSLVLRHFYCWFGAHGKAKHHSGSMWKLCAIFFPRTRKPRQKEEKTRVLIFFSGVHVSWPDFLSPDSISWRVYHLSPPSTSPTQGFWEIFQIQTIATPLWPWAWNLAIWVQCFLSCKVREVVLTSKEIAQA